MNQQHRTVLKALFRMAREDRPADLSLVANELGLSCAQTDRILEQLDQAGLVDVDCVRLTMAGLAMAVSIPAVTASKDSDRRKVVAA